MIVDYAVYRDGQRVEEQLALDQLFEHSRDQNSFAWIGLHEPTPEEFDAVRREFDLHELAVEDAVNAHQRPKLEKYDDSVFIVLKTASYSEDHLEFGEILIFVGGGLPRDCAARRQRAARRPRADGAAAGSPPARPERRRVRDHRPGRR